MGEYLKEAKNAVEDAVNTGDYRELSNRLGYLAEDAIDELNQAVGTFCGNNKKNNESQKQNTPPFQKETRENHYYTGAGQPGETAWGIKFYREQKEKWNRRKQKKQRRDDGRNDTIYVPKVKVKGRVSSVVYTVFGTIGMIGFGITALVLFAILAGQSFADTQIKLLTEVFSAVTVISFIMLGIGIKQGKFVNRFGIYQSLLSKKNVCEVKRMAEYVNKSEKFVIKELKKMMAFQMFREAHFDENKRYFMLGDEIYEQYKQAEKGYQERTMEHKQEQTDTKKKADSVVNEELETAIQEGRSYIQQIRRANDDIPGEEISRKLDRLEDLIAKIFICVEKHPEKLPEIRKFMQYYLPITMKLVNAYKEFDSQSIQGDTIRNSKQEIENTLDTIDLAFEKLLDSLYEDEAMEVSSDISVLKTLFAQEGLTKKDFDMNK